MAANGSGQIDERVELLQLARPRDGEQTLHGAFTSITAV
jgi:hypothetical protein